MRSPIPLVLVAILAACDGEDQAVRPSGPPQLALRRAARIADKDGLDAGRQPFPRPLTRSREI